MEHPVNRNNAYAIVSMARQQIPLQQIAAHWGFKSVESLEDFLRANGYCVECNAK